jgi:hypothetical protein
MPTVSAPAVGDLATSAWADSVSTALSNIVSSSGGLVYGTYSATKSVNTAYVRLNSTTDANGLFTISLVSTAILSVNVINESGSAGTPGLIAGLRNDLTNGTTVTIQMRTSSTGAAAATTAFVSNIRIDYQQ